MRSRGFSLVQVLIVLGAASAVIATAWGAVSWHARTHYQRGFADKQVEWDKKEEERRQADRARADAVSAALLLQQQRADAAEALAAEADRQWKEARREANRSDRSLASCRVGRAADADRTARPAGEPAGAELAAAPSAGGDPAGGAVAVYLHWRFVGLHDAAFTGIDGKPLFGAAAGHAFAPERADTASPYTLEDVVDVHGENARGYSDCLRKFDEAMSKIAEAAAAWDAGRR